MSGRLLQAGVAGLLLVGVFAGSALASDVDGRDGGADVARLEALLAAQQQQIAALEHQVAAAQQGGMDAARAAQMKMQIREVLSETEFRESLMPSTLTAGYDKGFFIKSTDDKFKMKFNGMMQFRYTYYEARNENRYLLPGFRRQDRSGFDLARVRFRVSGHAYTKDLTYLLEMDMSQGSGYDARVQYAWVNYRFADEFQVKAGVFLVGGTRAGQGSTATMQFVEYPMINSVFGLGRGTGVRIWGDLLEGQGRYNLDIVNSLGTPGTRTITNDEDLYTTGHDNNPAIIFRTVWAILGGHCLHPDDAGDWVAPCDMAIHDEPALNVGFHYAFNEDWHDGTLRIPFKRQTFFRSGGFGLTSSDGLQVNQFGVDAGFKYMGFSATAEYVMRILDVRNAASPPFTPLFQWTGDASTNVQHGAYVQCGYFLPIPGHERKFEVVGRVGGMTANSGGVEGTWIYAAGLNYYIEGHNVKLQADVTKVSESPTSASGYSLANVNDDPLIFRVQLQLTF
jgi:phosphate-selective porin OprO/OprP